MSSVRHTVPRSHAAAAPRHWKSLALACLGAGLLHLSTPALAQAPVSPGSVAPQGLQAGTMAARMAACTACHGASGSGSADGYFPRIAGKPAEYLYRQLLGFRDGQRQYRPMQTLLAYQSDAYLLEMAEWFARQTPDYPPTRTGGSVAQRERGRLLAKQGDAARGVPACAAI